MSAPINSYGPITRSVPTLKLSQGASFPATPLQQLKERLCRPELHQPTVSAWNSAEGLDDRCVFTVDAGADGLWYVSSRDRHVGGVFNNRKAAVILPMTRAATLPHAVVVTHDGSPTTHEEVLDHGRVAGDVASSGP